MSDHSSIPPFNPNEDPSSVFPRWERWLRAFELLLISKNITDETRKKAMLLHHGGFDLQDIFYAIPNADIVPEGGAAYELTKTALTSYFNPKVNTTYERHIFRSMFQQENESTAQYVIRLRQQSRNCAFTDENDEIKDQVVEHCASTELRKRLLEKSTVSLDEVLEIAQALEAASRQIKKMESGSIARLSVKQSLTKMHQKQKEN